VALKMTQLDLQRYPLLGFRPESSPEPPADPSPSQFWHNSTDDTLNVFIGGRWQQIGESQMLLLEPGAEIPLDTPANKIIFEKAT
jgi:hypothetical protein